MSETAHILRTGKSLDELCKASGVDIASAPEFDEPRGLVTLLREQQKVTEAIGLLAHALPPREAVWWAWSCARDSCGDDPPEEIGVSIGRTGQWIKDPTDENRRAAYDAALQADVATAVGCVGAAAFFTGDTLGPADQAPVPPEEYMAAKAIAGSLLLAASDDPDTMLDRLSEFLDRGLEIADRVHLWRPPDA
jgi:hypothetical protein